jgi:hypothetical protein
MDASSKKYNLNKEHEEIGKDIINVLISYTPLSGFMDTAKFVHKWAVKKKGVKRIARHVGKHAKKISKRNNKKASNILRNRS